MRVEQGRNRQWYFARQARENGFGVEKQELTKLEGNTISCLLLGPKELTDVQFFKDSRCSLFSTNAAKKEGNDMRGPKIAGLTVDLASCCSTPRRKVIVRDSSHITDEASSHTRGQNGGWTARPL